MHAHFYGIIMIRMHCQISLNSVQKYETTLASHSLRFSVSVYDTYTIFVMAEGNELNIEHLRDVIKGIVQEEIQPAVLSRAEAKAKEVADQTANISKLKAKLDQKRINDSITFSKQGHYDQFKHNTEVAEKFDDAIEAMESADVEGLKDALTQGKKLIEIRNQHLRIADAYGWLTVKEFKANELTSGEVEEKRLKRAIKSADNAKSRFFNKKPKLSDDPEYNKAIKSKTEQRSKMDEVVCYSCKRIGHYVTHCPFSNSTTPLSYSSKTFSSSSRSSSSSGSSSSKTSRDGKSKSG